MIDVNRQRSARFRLAWEGDSNREDVDEVFGRSHHHGRSIHKMKVLISLCGALLLASGCGERSNMPEGISIQRAETGDVVVTLRDGRGIAIRQEKPNGRKLIVGNVDGALSATQLEPGGLTPVGVRLFTSNKAEITTMRGSHATKGLPVTMDEDGDGIPEWKIDASGRYRLKSIEWEKVGGTEGERRTEPAHPAEPSRSSGR